MHHTPDCMHDVNATFQACGPAVAGRVCVVVIMGIVPVLADGGRAP